jgi:hypothetical protein
MSSRGPSGVVYACAVAEIAEERASVRPGRCTNHPGAKRVGKCTICALPLCVTCAVPVRGTIVGVECLGRVVDDPPPRRKPPFTANTRVRPVAVAGFGLALVASVFPWSRFGNDSGWLQAWTINWSLLAASAAAAGVLFAVLALRRPPDPRTETLAYLGLALLVAFGALLHLDRPPPLSASSLVPWLAVAGSVVAFGAGLAQAVALIRWSLMRA